ncbi:20174_t:CDS:2, partial [Funneliformis geosporum]
MFDQPDFNNNYDDLLKHLPPFVKRDVWLRLTTRKNNSLFEEQVRRIHLDIEELLTREVNRYFRKRDHQMIKIEANTASDDGFKKQLKEHETLLRQKEINIKKTIKTQVAKEHKYLKDEYDTLKSRLETRRATEIRSDDLERQYKFRINTLDKSNAMKDKEISKLSATIFQLKKDKNALKQDFTSAKKNIKVLDSIIY